jgi:hypothetical protein
LGKGVDKRCWRVCVNLGLMPRVPRGLRSDLARPRLCCRTSCTSTVKRQFMRWGALLGADEANSLQNGFRNTVAVTLVASALCAESSHRLDATGSAAGFLEPLQSRVRGRLRSPEQLRLSCAQSRVRDSVVAALDRATLRRCQAARQRSPTHADSRLHFYLNLSRGSDAHPVKGVRQQTSGVRAGRFHTGLKTNLRHQPQLHNHIFPGPMRQFQQSNRSPPRLCRGGCRRSTSTPGFHGLCQRPDRGENVRAKGATPE